MAKNLVLVHDDDVTAAKLDGGTFQIHILRSGMLRLYPVKIRSEASCCPVILAGEQCALAAGHAGKHMWGSGD